MLPTISNQVKRYDEIIAEFSNDGYDIRGYVTSQHPMRADQGGDKKSYVKNNDPTHCNAGRRSNFKYYTVNTTYKKYVKSSEYPNISFVDTFTGIVDTSGDKAKWTFKSDWKSYSTVDGIHWDDKTAEKYFKYWMGLNKSL